MKSCTLPPAGWWCSRDAGHRGPCAARQIEDDETVAPGWPGVDATAQQMSDFETARNLYLAYLHSPQGLRMSDEDMLDYLFAAAYWSGFDAGKKT